MHPSRPTRSRATSFFASASLSLLSISLPHRSNLHAGNSAQPLLTTGQMEHEHSAEAIHQRLIAGPGHNYLRDWIYGGIDGSVTTFAVVSGVVGAQLSPLTILILGFANLF